MAPTVVAHLQTVRRPHAEPAATGTADARRGGEDSVPGLAGHEISSGVGSFSRIVDRDGRSLGEFPASREGS
jgi:hypothetical protein